MADFMVSILQMSGSTASVACSPEEDLLSLCAKVAGMLQVPHASVKLMLGDEAFSPSDSLKSLSVLGIGQGTVLTFVRLPLLDVKVRMRVEVQGAGTDHVNGTYVARAETSFILERGEVYLQKIGGTQCISWYGQKDRTWPAGWYMEESHGGDGIYYISSTDMKSLPCNSWTPYCAERFSQPGDEPTPIIAQKVPKHRSNPVTTRKTAPKDGAKGKTMTKAALVNMLAEKHEMKTKACSSLIQSLAALASAELKRTGVFMIPGLCRIKTHAKPATMGGVRAAFGRNVNVKAKPARLIVKAYPVSAFSKQM